MCLKGLLCHHRRQHGLRHTYIVVIAQIVIIVVSGIIAIVIVATIASIIVLVGIVVTVVLPLP